MTALSLTGRQRWVDFRGVPAKGWDFFYATLAAAGITGAIRYIDGGSESKQITSAERQAANKHGRKLLLVDETATGDAWDPANDYAAGQARARGALADAKAQGFAAIGIAAAADAHADVRQVADAVQYAKGFALIVTRRWAGFYGFREVLVAVRAANVVSWLWLAGSMPTAEDAKWLAFWQDNRTRPVYAGVECDINWRLDGPLPGNQENDMDAAQSAKLDLIYNRNKAYLNAAVAAPAYAARLESKLDALTKVAAQLASDPNTTADQLRQMIDDAAAANKPTADDIRAAVLPGLQDAVLEVLGADNADQAQQVFDLFVDKLTSKEGATA